MRKRGIVWYHFQYQQYYRDIIESASVKSPIEERVNSQLQDKLCLRYLIKLFPIIQKHMRRVKNSHKKTMTSRTYIIIIFVRRVILMFDKKKQGQTVHKTTIEREMHAVKQTKRKYL